MFGKRLALFELFGFKVQVDISWVLLAVLVTWSLASGYFPVRYPDLTPVAYWWMGIVGLPGTGLLDRLSRIVAFAGGAPFQIPIRGITLFIFGGVAEMDEEPPSPRAEFFMAIAGPIASFALAAAFYGLAAAAEARSLPVTVSASQTTWR